MAKNQETVPHLTYEEGIIAFTVDMQIEVSLEELCDWFAPTAKGMKARPKMTKETIKNALNRLVALEIVVSNLFTYAINPKQQDLIALSIVQHVPEETKAIAKTITSSLKNYFSFPKPEKHITLGQRKSILELKAWANRMFFANNSKLYERVLFEGYRLLSLSEKLTEKEYINKVCRLLFACPVEVLRDFDQRFTVLKKIIIEKYEDTEKDPGYILADITSLIEQTKPATSNEALLTQVVVSRLQEFPSDVSVLAHLPSVAATVSLLRGNDDDAELYFDEMPSSNSLVGIGHVLREMYDYLEEIADLDELSDNSRFFTTSPHPNIINAYLASLNYLNDQPQHAAKILASSWNKPDIQPAEWAMFGAILVFCGYKLSRREEIKLETAFEKTDWGNTPFAHGEFCRSLGYLMPRYAEANGAKHFAYKYQKEYGWRYLSDWITEAKGGAGSAKSVLRLLQKLAKPEVIIPKPKPKTQSRLRLIYLLDTREEEIEIKEQTLNKKGNWTPGKLLSVEKFGIKAYEKKLDEKDIKVASTILGDSGKPARYLNYGFGVEMNEYYAHLPYKAALYHLAGHDNVVLGNKNRTPITITEAEPTFSVVDTPDGIQLMFTPSGASGEYHYEHKTPTLITVYRLTENEIELSQKLSSSQLIPHEQRADLEATLPELRKSIRVSSLIDIDTDALPKVEGNIKPAAHLLPFEGGYDMQLVLQPIPGTPYFVTPGEGMPQDIVTIDPEADVPERVLLSRKLDLEQSAITQVLAIVESLSDSCNELLQWSFPSPASALQLLRELYEAQLKELLTIEYPKGQKLKLTAQVNSKSLSLQVGQARDWFAVTGSLRIDENRVLDFAQLLAHARKGEGRFVELGEDDYLEISDELSARLTNLEALLHERSGKVSIPQLAANALEDLISDLDDVELDDQWKAQIARAEKAKKVSPRVPKNFDAALRDYQKEGFDWMIRLSAWGVGACLADDMGLGKTIQALALLTSRAKEGPALVLAPASVTRNWVRETEKFAPALTPILVATSSDIQLIDEAGKGDLLIISYGLISYIEAELTTIKTTDDKSEPRRFATLLLDEAQAIKNPAAKRTKLVYSLEADFKLALTGTPIENNLGELWSLFRYLNPGLLGSLQAFTSKYARPLSATTPNPALAEQLRRLVQPFILRRRKDQVLKELPAKTEIVLEVIPGEKERALYEAIRREAVDKLANATSEQQRFMVLQQLTRLRQAACHPKLVRPQSKLESAKLKLVGETIQELIANGHRALIFSQFVKHLKLVEAWVQAAGISYNYLDGATPGKKREELVNSFQAGEAELFLISLKAGGTGLNLTQADYVLHLDPWWNPAAEDQASDRAHRIGQQRPVTVYRFVSRGTIEESIINLHAEKRDLADQLLSGTDQSAKLSVSDMLELVKEG